MILRQPIEQQYDVCNTSRIRFAAPPWQLVTGINSDMYPKLMTGRVRFDRGLFCSSEWQLVWFLFTDDGEVVQSAIVSAEIHAIEQHWDAWTDRVEAEMRGRN